MDEADLVLVGPLPPPPGGMANQTRLLAERLEAEGLRVLCVRSNAPYRPAWAGRVRGLRALVRLLPYLAALWRAAGRAPVMHLMANSGWSWHLVAAPALWIARWRRCGVVLNYRGGEAGPFFARQWRWVRPSLEKADAVAVPSPFLARLFAGYGVRAAIVPNIVEPSTPRAPARDGAAFRILVARNLEAIYDVATALRGFARLAAEVAGAELFVAGQGPERPALEAMVHDLGLEGRVRFLGALPHAELLEWMAGADLLLNTSRVDNSPNALLEACALGVPVLSTAAGGIPDLVEDG